MRGLPLVVTSTRGIEFSYAVFALAAAGTASRSAFRSGALSRAKVARRRERMVVVWLWSRVRR